jgi:hypothetical protein
MEEYCSFSGINITSCLISLVTPPFSLLIVSPVFLHIDRKGFDDLDLEIGILRQQEFLYQSGSADHSLDTAM